LNWTGHVNRINSKRKVRYLIIIPTDDEKEDDQKIDGGTVYKQILIDAKLKLEGEVKNSADWEKPIKEAKVPRWIVVPSKKKKIKSFIAVLNRLF
jgi:hypothetical protein